MTLFVKYETTSLLYDVFQYLYTSVNFSLHINELLFAIFFRLIEWIYISKDETRERSENRASDRTTLGVAYRCNDGVSRKLNSSKQLHVVLFTTYKDGKFSSESVLSRSWCWNTPSASVLQASKSFRRERRSSTSPRLILQKKKKDLCPHFYSYEQNLR